MSLYQRYQTVTAASQELFHPDCPVYVSRYRLLSDVETGDRFLQLRLINLSEKTVRGVFVCVRCFDAAEQALAVLELVPVTGQNAAPGRSFGEDKLLTLWPRRSVYAEILPQRVEFSDGSAWNLDGPLAFYAIAPAKPVQRTDPLYPRLADAALRRGVHNDFYYSAQRGTWRCTCGVPNSAKSLRCACCGAERSWLEQYMDPAALEAAPRQTAPEPVFSLPDLIPASVPARSFVPEPLVSEELLRPYAAAGAPPEEEEEPAPEPPRKRKWVAWTLASVLTLLLAGIAVGVWFLVPYLHYMQGVKAQNSGDYERALAIFTQLEGERDSAERIVSVRKAQAMESMKNGDYEDAIERLQELPESEDLIADCIYSLGVLACNEGDVAKGLEYVRQLEAQFPGYDKLAELKNNCNYRLACMYMDQAQELGVAEDEGNYETALELLDSAEALFAAMPDFLDSATLKLECRHRAALQLLFQSEFDAAREIFLELGDYNESADMALECDYQKALALFNGGEYLQARDLFYSLGSYADSAEQFLECGYRLAKRAAEEGRIPEAVEMFGELGDYRNSSNQRDLLMLGFVRAYYFDENADAELLYEYLDELLERDVSGTQELVDQLISQSVLIRVNLFEDGAEQGDVITTSSLDALYFHYRLRLRESDSPSHILLQYQLPDGSTGTAPVNPDGGSAGDIPWSKLIPKKCEQAGNVWLRFSFADSDDDRVLANVILSYDPSLLERDKNGDVVVPEGMSVYSPKDGDGEVIVYAANESEETYFFGSSDSSSSVLIKSSPYSGIVVYGDSAVGGVTKIIGMDGDQTDVSSDNGNLVIRFSTDDE